MTTYLSAVLVIFAVFAGWLGVQHLARVFARRHPEFGPVRDDAGGCGSCCGCSRANECRNEDSPDHKHT